MPEGNAVAVAVAVAGECPGPTPEQKNLDDVIALVMTDPACDDIFIAADKLYDVVTRDVRMLRAFILVSAELAARHSGKKTVLVSP
jgi:hypothetical protein